MSSVASPFSADANRDYVLYWLPYGVTGTSPEGTRLFHVQTPRYLAGFDFHKMTFTRFSALPDIAREAQPDKQSDRLFASARPASMQMRVLTRDGEYLLSGWNNRKARPLLYDGGKFCYLIKIENAMFRRADGDILPAETVFEFHAWADKLFVTILVKPTSDIEVLSAGLDLAFEGDFGRYFGVSGGLDISERLGPEASFVGCGDLNSFYSDDGSGVAVISSVPSDYESHSVRCGASQVTYAASIYDRARHGGRARVWRAGKTQSVSFQLLGTMRDHVKNCTLDLENERESVGLSVISGSGGAADACKGYQPRAGYYLIDNPASKITKGLYRDLPNFTESVKFRADNPSSHPRRVRLMVSQGIPGGIEGPSSVLVDGDGWPTGLDVQVSKNWHGQLWYHSYTVLNLEPGQVQDQSMLVAFQNWGTKPSVCHGQLSLVGYDTEIKDWQNAPVNCQAWYEMSQGLTESICYDPTALHCGNVVCDVRPMFYPEPTGSWWATNVGGADFLAYYDKNGAKTPISQPKIYHDKQCNCLADIEHVWFSSDGAVRESVRARSFANTDMLRCVYNIRLDAVRKVEFSRLSLFTLGAPNYNACRPHSLAWGTDEGLREVSEIDYSAKGYMPPSILADKPNTWVALYNDEAPLGGSEVDGGANRGLIVRSCRARIHGKPSSGVTLDVNRIAGTRDRIQMLLEVNPSSANGTLDAGDYIEAEIEMIVYHKSPKAYVGPNPTMKHLLETYGDSWQPVYWDARHNAIRATASKGAILGAYPVIVKLDSKREAEFALTGGMGYVPIEIRGYGGYKDISLQQWVDGKWVTIDQSVNGKDFWQAQFDTAERTYTGVFNVPIEPTGEEPIQSRFRVVR